MNYRKVLIILTVLLLLPFAIKVRGNDFGQTQSLFTDIKAHQVGDLLTVLIYEQSRASNKVESKTEKSTDVSTQGGPGIGTLSFIPLFGASATNETSFDGKGENIRNGSLRAKMSVTIIGVKTNGDLIIEGSRIVGISGDKEILQLSGTVRRKDVRPNNTIDSYLIADAEIHYNGKGAGTTATRPGIFTRIVSWIF